MGHFGEDDVDSSDVHNYVPTFLVSDTQHVYEVMDNNDDICFALLQLDGEEGMKALWGSYVKYPNNKFLKHC